MLCPVVLVSDFDSVCLVLLNQVLTKRTSFLVTGRLRCLVVPWFKIEQVQIEMAKFTQSVVLT